MARDPMKPLPFPITVGNVAYATTALCMMALVATLWSPIAAEYGAEPLALMVGAGILSVIGMRLAMASARVRGWVWACAGVTFGGLTALGFALGEQTFHEYATTTITWLWVGGAAGGVAAAAASSLARWVRLLGPEVTLDGVERFILRASIVVALFGFGIASTQPPPTPLDPTYARIVPGVVLMGIAALASLSVFVLQTQRRRALQTLVNDEDATNVLYPTPHVEDATAAASRTVVPWFATTMDPLTDALVPTAEHGGADDTWSIARRGDEPDGTSPKRPVARLPAAPRRMLSVLRVRAACAAVLTGQYLLMDAKLLGLL